MARKKLVPKGECEDCRWGQIIRREPPWVACQHESCFKDGVKLAPGCERLYDCGDKNVGGRCPDFERRKVFCSECRHSTVCQFYRDCLASARHCQHQSCFEDNYWKRGAVRVMDLATKNKENDCPDFEAKQLPLAPPDPYIDPGYGFGTDVSWASLKAEIMGLLRRK
jgi:hypothetical protein